MFEKMSRMDLERFRATGSFPDYVAFLGDMRKGDGGRIDVASAGVGRQTVKNRLKISAEALGLQVKFVRSKPTDVVFEVVAKTIA